MKRVGLGVLLTGFVCPCHVFVAVLSWMAGTALIPPAVQDGIHAVYMPAAVLSGVGLLRLKGILHSWSSRNSTVYPR